MKNWSLNKKIWGILSLLIMAFVFSASIASVNLIEGRDSMQKIGEVHFKRALLSNTIRDGQRQLALASLETILKNNPSEIKDVITTFNRLYENQQKVIEEYQKYASGFGAERMAEYLPAQKSWLEIVKKSQELALINQDLEADQILSTGLQYRSIMLKSTQMLVEYNEKQTTDTIAAASENAQRSVIMTAIISVASIFTSIFVAFFVLRAVTRAIATVVQNLSDSSIQVSGAASQIASSSEELSQAATEQAASLEETAASVEEMNSMIGRNSENANAAAQTSTRSQDAVAKGKTVIQRMIASMEAINQSSEGMAETVKVIEQIDKKTKVINEIVNKTELLSFNASVEAARAGEHGKGFAVVAEEVGNLARMSGAAAEEIASLLEESINKVNQMVTETKKNVDTGAQVTRECGEVFEEVVHNVTSVSGMATEIASASHEQARGCTEITKAMTQLDQMTQQNAATSEECASAAEELSAQAEALKTAVGQLVSTVNGGSANTQDFSLRPAGATEAPARKQQNKPATVVHLRSQKAINENQASAPLKKASGSAPGYDSDGFTDV